ncbi:hypothetical protein BDP81DRAFT_432664 [Colletotrichum phormii]|uniref:Uncharacterized protein n=1 Tax=Colletotrichum phormii TaxID=359342 RepID=A0AAI9ZNW6_9PEZI|nr:uncharacterized protein BDP81DRAFT_432664 [Colletotrichum phormii]KAK1634353.1 hypothetical protein BDP81DRAFT_432664 [Colletotrichum phormii]
MVIGPAAAVTLPTPESYCKSDPLAKQARTTTIPRKQHTLIQLYYIPVLGLGVLPTNASQSPLCHLLHEPDRLDEGVHSCLRGPRHDPALVFTVEGMAFSRSSKHHRRQGPLSQGSPLGNKRAFCPIPLFTNELQPASGETCSASAHGSLLLHRQPET